MMWFWIAAGMLTIVGMALLILALRKNLHVFIHYGGARNNARNEPMWSIQGYEASLTTEQLKAAPELRCLPEWLRERMLHPACLRRTVRDLHVRAELFRRRRRWWKQFRQNRPIQYQSLRFWQVGLLCLKGAVAVAVAGVAVLTWLLFGST
jgi:hypothetical protein